ncbi:MAG TPA: glutamate--tRNA ligase [Longimicrobiaceae bacterium]|nr:glutamate--tRNA ligase [Longimicrobiaceae bacterium]
MTAAPRVRFAPSPTGYLHVGGARTALFNWLFARNQGGVFVLRIEDTDRERSNEEMTRAILEGMQWLGLDWDEGPFHQADGSERHQADVQRLLESGHAYRCFCTPAELQARREAAGDSQEAFRYDRVCLSVPAEESARRAAEGEIFTVRFQVPEGTTEWDDLVHGPTRFPNEGIEDFIILRSDGSPIYNLAVVSDDIEMRITHVIRGDDHLSNTPKQILLYRALGIEPPLFAHLPMILGPDGKRLSKRHGATAVGEYAGQGILPQALVNFLALLGWSTGDDTEIMLLPELIQRFSVERINKKSAVFDTEKLEWMNGQHLAMTPAADLLPLVSPRLVAEGLLSEIDVGARHDWLLELIGLLKVRTRSVEGIPELARPFLAPTVEYEREAVAKHWQDPEEVATRLAAVGETLASLEPWEPQAIEQALRQSAERLGVGFGKLVHPLRVALTGTAASPGIDAVIALQGRALVARRLEQARAALTVGNKKVDSGASAP